MRTLPAPHSDAGERTAPARDHREWLVGVALVATAGCATLIATRSGSYLTPDSVTYWSMARHLARGEGAVDFTRTPTTVFPPGYPIVLAGLLRLRMSLGAASRVLNAASIATFVWLAWQLLRRHMRSFAVAFAASVPLALSAALLDLGRHSWSEPLFCVLMIAFIARLPQTLKDPTPRRVCTIALIADAALFIRYAAASLVALGVVALWLAGGRNGRQRLHSTALFVALALGPFGLWLARNATTGQRVLGPRVGDAATATSLVVRLLGAIAQLFVPVWSLETWSTAAKIGFYGTVMVLAGAATTNRVRRVRRTRHDRLGRSAAPTDAHTLERLLVAFAVIYTAMLLVSARTSGSSIDPRTAAPLYPTVMMFAALRFDRTRAAARTAGRPTAGLINALAVGFVALSVGWFAAATAAPSHATMTFATRPAPGSLTEQLRAHPPHGLLVSNHPWTISAAVGYEPLRPYPAQLVPGVSILPATYTEMVDNACHGGLHVAWYAAAPVSPPPLSADAVLTPSLRGTDGVLYAVTFPARTCSNARP